MRTLGLVLGGFVLVLLVIVALGWATVRAGQTGPDRYWSWPWFGCVRQEEVPGATWYCDSDVQARVRARRSSP